MVVLVGSGHVAYGLGAERQARLWFSGKTASVDPDPDPRGGGRAARGRGAGLVRRLRLGPAALDRAALPGRRPLDAGAEDRRAVQGDRRRRGLACGRGGIPGRGRARLDRRRALRRQGNGQSPDGGEALGRPRRVPGRPRREGAGPHGAAAEAPAEAGPGCRSVRERSPRGAGSRKRCARAARARSRRRIARETRARREVRHRARLAVRDGRDQRSGRRRREGRAAVPAARRAEAHLLRSPCGGAAGRGLRRRALLRHGRRRRGSLQEGEAQALSAGPARGRRLGAPRLRGPVPLRALGQEGGVHARLPRDLGHGLEGRPVPGRERVLVPVPEPGARRVRDRRLAARGLAPDRSGQGPLARRGRPRALGLAGTRRRDHARRRPARRVPRVGRRRRDARLPAPEGRHARREVPRGDGAVPRDVPRPRRSVSLRQVRARRELLGDGLRHALLHAARPAGHPLPVHPDVLLSARDPAQLVGQRRLRRLRERELVRGAHRLPGRLPDPGAARARRRVPPRHAREVPELREGRAATSRSRSSARARAPPRRRSATARR